MSTLILIRHGRSTANNDGVLAGRTPGVDLDATGAAQAVGLVARLAGVDIASLISSPLARCLQTIEPLAAAAGVDVVHDDRVIEVDYGEWTGRTLTELAEEPLWRTVQTHPAAAQFPGGESLAAVSARAVLAVREHCAAAGDSGTVVVCSHGDVIKSILADALGLHLDLFQRIVVSPGSVSVVRYGPLRPFVERVNDTGTLDSLRTPPPGLATVGEGPAGTGGNPSSVGVPAGDAPVGGDPGAAAPPPAAEPTANSR